jgi:hypothetical protein
VTTARLLVAIGLLSLSTVTWAAAGGAATRPAGGPAGRTGRGAGQAPANLEAAMRDMDRAYRALKAEAADPTKIEQSLRDLATMQRDVTISKLQTPPSVNRLAGDKKAEAVTSYRTMMNGLLKALLDLEDAVTAKKADDIKKGFEEVDQIMKQGHAEFIKED